ncbi:MAG: hypothetical protein HUK20_10050 [Fibrobacter sp.]|nr:hypothetical protein [Fibrobacter sp.]
MESVTLKGVAQKGPFAKGSVVTVYGLDSTFVKTKRTFKGSVNDDEGNFSISGISLECQYALVEVNGFFMNEVTGKITTGTKTKLSALVDLGKGGTVKANLNVLTPLEMNRALYLVRNENYNVPAAKKRATREILSAFGFDTDVEEATELNILGEGASVNSLFAASVALMGKLSPYKFGNRIQDMSESFANTGKIDGTLRAEIADQLSSMDSAGAISEIAKNIRAMNPKANGVDVMLNGFWNREYGLPVCNGENEKIQEKNANKLSENYGASYVCTSNRWHKSTALDSELGLCVDDAEGTYKQSKAKKYYTCKAGQWSEITSLQYELKECTDSIANDDIKKYKSVDDKNFFLCKDKQWEELGADEFELKDCTKDIDKKIVATQSENVYVCENGSWREATAQEAAFGYCAVVDSTKFKEMKEDYYVCLGDGWVEVDALIAELGFCSSKIEGSFKVSESKKVYACVAREWIESNGKSAAIGKLCAKGNDGETTKVTKGDFVGDYACADGDWTLCSAQNNLNVLVDQKLACEDGLWRKASTEEIEATMVCSESTENVVSNGYVCSVGENVYQWRAADAGEKVTGKVCGKTQVEGTVNREDSTKVYVCEKGVWRTPKAGESETGSICTSSNKNVVDASAGYACVLGTDGVYGWRVATDMEKTTEKICGVTVENNTIKDGSDNKKYTCVNNAWRKSNEGEMATSQVCLESLANTVSSKGIGFVCRKDANSEYNWRAASSAELAVGEVCGYDYMIGDKTYSRKNFLAVKGDYVCDYNNNAESGYDWRPATSDEKTAGFVCTEDSYLVRNGLACVRGKFRTATKLENEAGIVCLSDIPYRDDWLLDSQTDPDTKLICDNISGSYQLRYATPVEKAIGICGRYDVGRIFYYSESDPDQYICTDKQWKKFTGYSKASIGGTSYKTVTRGSLVWMAEDMKNTPTTGNMYCYNNASSCTEKLYDYTAAKSICPTPWRLPTENDWKNLAQILGRDDGSIALCDLLTVDAYGEFRPWVNESCLGISYVGLKKYTSSTWYNNLFAYWMSEDKVFGQQYSSDYLAKVYYTDNVSIAPVRCVKDY